MVVAVVVEAGVVVVAGVVGKVSGFSGTGYSYPVTGSSDGHNGTPASRNSWFLPTDISVSAIQSGTYSAVVVFDNVDVGVLVVLSGKLRGFSGT